MTVNDKIITILTEKQQKHQHYHQVKLINMNILQVKKYYCRIIEQAKFTYSPLGKAFQKQIKTIKEQGTKQVEALEVLKPIKQKLAFKDAIPVNALSKEAKNELNKIKEIEKTVDRENYIIKRINIHIIFRIFEQ